MASDTETVVEFLSRVSGFDSIERAELEALAAQVEVSAYEPGKRIIRRGDPGDKMYVIREGHVQVPVLDDKGETRLVARLGPAEIFGEMALLTGEPRVADVLAEDHVVVLGLARDSVQPLLHATPPLARFLTILLGERLEEGDAIKQVGKYRLIGKIGQGATAQVFAAVHPRLDRVVAIKMLSHALAFDPTFRDRFLQEARTIAALNHPNIVQVYDVEEAYATFFLVMERISGQNLQSLMDSEGPLPASRTLSILYQVADALHFAHRRGIIHRDVKPANIAIDAYGRVKLMDFGIARRVQPRKKKGRDSVVEGSPRYMAPEAALGEPLDGRADIYSLAVVAYEMVAGQPLFSEPTLNRLLEAHVRKPPPDVAVVRPHLPPGLVEFIRRGLEKDPERRLSSWPRILELLKPDGRIPMTLEQGVEQVIRIRYLQDSSAEVTTAVDSLLEALSTIEGVSVATGELHMRAPVTPDDSPTSGDRTVKVPSFKLPFFGKKR